ncbi:MAG TPA: CooT family nickel-binding protein [Candidatus Methanomethylophilaceae archaeon]|nr:CooT family nickel-binding protein [Candidatus Methanomethylophilaceae archaeon]
MCESTVLLETAKGISSVMQEAVLVRDNAGSVTCVDILGREVIVDDSKVLEIDLMRHRVLLSRL